MLNVVQTILFTSALASYRNENWCDSDSECPRGQFCVPSDTGTCQPGIFNPMTGEDFRCAHECSTKAHYPKSKSGSEIIYRPVPKMGRMDVEADEPMMGRMEDAGTVVFTPEAGAYCRYDSHCASFERCTTSNFCIRKSGALHGERCERPKHYQCAQGHACSRAGYCVNQSGSPLGAKCAKDSHCSGSLVCEKFGAGDGTCQRFMGRRLDGDDTLEINDAVEDIARRLGEATEVFTPGEATEVFTPAYPFCRYSYDCASFEYCTTDNFCLRKTGGLHGERCEKSFHCAQGHACSRAGFCVDQNDQGGLGERCAKDSHCAGSLVCEKFGGLDGTCQRFMGRRLDGDATEADDAESDDGDDRRRLRYTSCHKDSDCFSSDEYCVTTGPTRPFCLKRTGGLQGDRCTTNSQCAKGHNCSRDQICANAAGAGEGQVCTRNYHCKGSLQCISHNGKPVDNGSKMDGLCGRESGRMEASMMAPPMGAMDAMDLIPFTVTKFQPSMGAMEDAGTVVFTPEAGGFCRADSHCASFERCTTSNFCIRKSGALHGERCERPKHYQCAQGHACSRAGYCVNQSGSPLGAKCAKDSHCSGSLVCEKFGAGDGTCQRFRGRRLDGEAGPAPMM